MAKAKKPKAGMMLSRGGVPFARVIEVGVGDQDYFVKFIRLNAKYETRVPNFPIWADRHEWTWS